ncbi:30S ribosomal protein S7 [Candidatus Micrarchaeota archaeon]|nr:30S ribosomal protein S7 [Candidatus Micrarchaeota archaeon]
MFMKLFGKYDCSEVVIEDLSLKQVISLAPISIPHSFGRHKKSTLGKMKVNVVERLVNKLMRGGTGEKTSGKVIRTRGQLQGKKLKLLNIVKKAFDIVEKRTKQNPVQMLIKALENAAPREDVTRVTYGGVSYQIAVDISATRRVDLALRNMTLAAIMGSFNKPKSLAESLANEIIYTAEGDSQKSYAIKKRDETERMARSAR